MCPILHEPQSYCLCLTSCYVDRVHSVLNLDPSDCAHCTYRSIRFAVAIYQSCKLYVRLTNGCCSKTPAITGRMDLYHGASNVYSSFVTRAIMYTVEPYEHNVFPGDARMVGMIRQPCT